jgi:hypothetical protein
VRLKGGMRLLPVPGTTARRSEPPDDFTQTRDGIGIH